MKFHVDYDCANDRSDFSTFVEVESEWTEIENVIYDNVLELVRSEVYNRANLDDTFEVVYRPDDDLDDCHKVVVDISEENGKG